MKDLCFVFLPAFTVSGPTSQVQAKQTGTSNSNSFDQVFGLGLGPRRDPRWQRGSNPSPLNPALHRPGCSGGGPSSASMTTARTLSAITSLAEYNLVCRDVHIERLAYGAGVRQDTFSSSLAKSVLLVRWRTHCICQGGRRGTGFRYFGSGILYF